MAARHSVRARRGVTMAELVLSIVMMVLVLGAISGLYISSIRLWYGESAAGNAHNQARWCVQWMMPVIREARRVDPIGSDHHRIEFVQPSASLDFPAGVTDGDTVAIYQANASGQYDTSGTEVWFSRNGTPMRALAHGVISEQGGPGFRVFYILTGGAVVPDIDAVTAEGLTGVHVVLTCQGRRHSATRSTTISGSVPLRNLE